MQILDYLFVFMNNDGCPTLCRIGLVLGEATIANNTIAELTVRHVGRRTGKTVDRTFFTAVTLSEIKTTERTFDLLS